MGERFIFYVGEYATVTASGMPGCGAGCLPLASTVEVDAHVVFAGTRIASVKPSRTLYYYRTRLGTVVATSLGGGVPGAGYRYTPYGEVDLAVNETEATRSELGYTNALRLTGSLLYLRNRVYDPEARVFIQPDTVDRLRYAYVTGDPANLSDPTGLEADQNAPKYQVIVNGTNVTIVARWADGSTKIVASFNTEIPIESQLKAEYKAQQAHGVALYSEALLDKVTTAAGSATQKLADYSVNEKNNGALRAGAAVLGAITSLADKESIGKTALTLAAGGAALVAAPAIAAALTPEAAAAGGAAAPAVAKFAERFGATAQRTALLERVITVEGRLNTSETVAGQLAAQRSYIPVQSILDTIGSGTRIADPQGVAGQFMYRSAASYNTTRGTLEVLVHEASGQIRHVLFRSGVTP